MSEKSNKELAVEVAIKYLEASGNATLPNGGSKNLLSLESVCNVIKGVCKTLDSLDKD